MRRRNLLSDKPQEHPVVIRSAERRANRTITTPTGLRLRFDHVLFVLCEKEEVPSKARQIKRIRLMKIRNGRSLGDTALPAFPIADEVEVILGGDRVEVVFSRNAPLFAKVGEHGTGVILELELFRGVRLEFCGVSTRVGAVLFQQQKSEGELLVPSSDTWRKSVLVNCIPSSISSMRSWSALGSIVRRPMMRDSIIL